MSIRTGIALACLLAGGCGLTADEQLFGVIDDTPPAVVQTFPEADWIQVPTSITARVWFSEAVDPESVWLSSIHLISGQDLAPVRYQVDQEPDGRGLVELFPREPLLPGVEYVLRITRKVTDWYGNPLPEEVWVSFVTMR